MSGLEYHVLLAMASGPRYGYAIKQAIEEDSDGAIVPGAGSLYRVLARMVSQGLVEETEAPKREDPYPGLERRYYELTPTGRNALATEARRLKEAAALAARRLGAKEGRP